MRDQRRSRTSVDKTESVKRVIIQCRTAAVLRFYLTCCFATRAQRRRRQLYCRCAPCRACLPFMSSPVSCSTLYGMFVSSISFAIPNSARSVDWEM